MQVMKTSFRTRTEINRSFARMTTPLKVFHPINFILFAAIILQVINFDTDYNNDKCKFRILAVATAMMSSTNRANIRMSYHEKIFRCSTFEPRGTTRMMVMNPNHDNDTDGVSDNIISNMNSHSNEESSCLSRRDWLQRQKIAIIIAGIASSPTSFAVAATSGFISKGFGKEEYTNSIAASKDTNISPKEAYETILSIIPQYLKKNDDNNNKELWALDVGAGAGVSTQILYEKLGFQQHLDAVDWSGEAWSETVLQCPPTVNFYEMDDERFFRRLQNSGNINTNVYRLIVYNFAINPTKAVYVAKTYLENNDESILFAPINDRQDYWYKQTYYILNVKGQILWKSKPDVGAWSVQFQPDVTSDTCQGVWCPPYNGFIKKK